MDPRHLERLVTGQRRQDAREAAPEHRLARARRAGQQHVVLPGGGELESAATALLPPNLGEIGQERLLELVTSRRGGERDLAPRRGDRRPPRPDGGRGRRRCPASAASGADSAAQRSSVRPARRAPSATAIVPATGRILPSSESSPTQACSSSRAGGSWCEPASSARAIGRSKPDPSFRSAAGARLTVIRCLRGPRQQRVDDAAVDPVLGLLARPVGEPDDRESGQVGRDEVGFDLDPTRFEADDGRGEGACEHSSDATPKRVPCLCRV